MGIGNSFRNIATLDPGATVKAETPTILTFPCAGSSPDRRGQRKELLSALRFSGSPVVVDFSSCNTLDHNDIDLLLACLAQVAGRDTKVLLVAGSRVNRVLLDVTRISALTPVFNSLVEALAYPHIPARNEVEESCASQSRPQSQTGSA
jgi:hypothetical protein